MRTTHILLFLLSFHIDLIDYIVLSTTMLLQNLGGDQWCLQQLGGYSVVSLGGSLFEEEGK